MSTHSKAALILALLALGAGIAHAEGIGSTSFGRTLFGGIGTFGKSGSGTAPSGSALVLEDGTSFLLLEDNSSHLCLEGSSC